MSTELSAGSLGIALNACLVTAMSMVALPLVWLLHFKLVKHRLSSVILLYHVILMLGVQNTAPSQWLNTTSKLEADIVIIVQSKHARSVTTS